jgi:phage terminase large subunit
MLAARRAKQLEEQLRKAQPSTEQDVLFGSDPLEFIREKLGYSPWSRQEEVVESTWENTITGVISGQKTGKTDIAACIAIAWVKTHREGVVRIAASSEDVIKDGLWAIVRRLLHQAPESLGPDPALDPSTGWRLDDTRRVLAVTAKTVNTMAGRSGAEQLWIVDEACGLDYPLWEVILGNLMGGGHLLWLTNPTTTSGKVYDWVTSADSSCHIIQIDSRETPNFPESKDYTGELIPGLATPEGVATIIKDYGEDSAEADVRIHGRFPRAGSNAVIPLALIDAGIARWATTKENGPLVIGADVARFGDDDSCIAPRRGQKVLTPETVHGFDTVQVAGKVVEVARRQRRNGERVTAVVEINGVGAGVFDNLIAQVADTSNDLWWLNVVAFDSGATAEEDEKYVNRRSELWFRGREFLAEGGAIPNFQRLKGELVAPVYGFDVRARRKVESKDDIKKKTKRSPDVADAVLISLTATGEGLDYQEPSFENLSRWGDYDAPGGFG